MVRNNTYEATAIMEAAFAQLSKLHFDTAAVWAENAMQAKLFLRAALDQAAEELCDEYTEPVEHEDTPSLDTSFHDHEMRG